MKTNQGHNLEIEISARSQPNVEMELIARIANGDESALEQLYHGYYNRLLRFITRINRRADRVDEIINEVMYVVWQKAGTYNQSCRPSTWIFGIAYNKARKTMQKSRFDEAESLDSMDSENSLLGRNNVELKQFETQNWLESAFEVLSPEQRTVVELTYFHGMHYNEIAELMVCPESTVKTRMHYARKKLAPILLSLENIDLIPGGINDE
jgi:RNA polymerase sigma-70 factor (ECF subfamily)